MLIHNHNSFLILLEYHIVFIFNCYNPIYIFIFINIINSFVSHCQLYPIQLLKLNLISYKILKQGYHPFIQNKMVWRSQIWCYCQLCSFSLSRYPSSVSVLFVKSFPFPDAGTIRRYRQVERQGRGCINILSTSYILRVQGFFATGDVVLSIMRQQLAS